MIKTDLLTQFRDLTDSVTKAIEATASGSPVELTKMASQLSELTNTGPTMHFKMDGEHQLVYGWASVVTEKGIPVEDLHGDIIPIEELEEAAHDFMQHSRQGDEMHDIECTGEVVGSMIFSKAVQDALGIDLQKEGWFVVYKVTNPETWEKVKDGTLRAFSWGGSSFVEAM